MSEIVIGDLLHWQRGLVLRPPATSTRADIVERVISWAVTLRASAPVLPPLRGGEIVVAPPRILAQIRDAEMIDRESLVRQLAHQPIAALMVDPSFAEGAVEGVPLLVASGTFPHDAESTLNRLITERRAELYRFGTDLTRALSTVTIAGAGIDALLDAAESIARKPLALLDGQLVTLARSSGAGDDVRLLAHDLIPLLEHRDGGTHMLRSQDGRSWLALPVARTPPQSRGAPGDQLILMVVHSGEGSTDVDRLLLAQTAGAIDLVLGQPGRIESMPRGRSSREPLVADLLLGRLASRDAAEARARLLGFDPGAPIRVVLVRGGPRLLSQARSVVPDDRGRASAAISDDELAILLVGDALKRSEWNDLAAMIRRAATGQEAASSPALVVTDAVTGAADVHDGLEQARALVRLIRDGAVPGPVVRADELDRLGLAGLLLPVVGHRHQRIDTAQLRQRMDRFATLLLYPLEDHDTQRGSEFISTLVAYLDQGGALAQAAERLGVHRNTLSYRLNRIAELTDRDLNDPQTRFLFQIALAIRALQRAAG